MRDTQDRSRRFGWPRRAALLAPIFLLLLGNLFGFFEILHARGLFWERESLSQSYSRFWSWMALRGLEEPPPTPYQWQLQPGKTVSWWPASRVIVDYDFDGQPVEVIDEFPNFSFILGDVHPHLLSMPFILISLGLSLEAFLAPEKQAHDFLKLPAGTGRLIFVSILIGSLAFLNIWDWPIYAAFYAAVWVFGRIRRKGWQNKRFWEFIMYGLGMALIGWLFFLPYFLAFSSQASGVLPALVFFTRGVHFWVMFAPFLVIIGVYLIWIWRQQTPERISLFWALRVILGATIILVVFNVIAAVIASRLPGLGQLFMRNLGAESVSAGDLLWVSMKRRLIQPGTFLTLFVLLSLSLGVIFAQFRKTFSKQERPIRLFIILLVFWGGVIVFLPEFVYLLDFFGKRMNTIFKFYYQAWMLWSLAAAFAAATLWRKWHTGDRPIFRVVLYLMTGLLCLILVLTAVTPSSSVSVASVGFMTVLIDSLWGVLALVLLVGVLFSLVNRNWGWVFRYLSVLIIGTALFYPVMAVPERARLFQADLALTLDGTDIYRHQSPDMMAAVDWLWTVDPAVLAEAVDPAGGSYSSYARISTLSGMPTVLGWTLHEVQWRGGFGDLETRAENLAKLYEADNWETAKKIIDMYNIEYIFVGRLEMMTYAVQEVKFEQNLALVFEQGDVRIYQVGLEH